MKITLKTQDVRNFLELSSNIKLESRSSFPDLSFICLKLAFGTCTMTKRNLNSFCENIFETSQFDDGVIYLEEDVLTEFVLASKQQIFTIEVNSKKIVRLHDGRLDPSFSVAGFDTSLYPESVQYHSAFQTLNTQVIKNLQSAKNCLGSDNLRPQFHCVYLDGNKMYSSDMMTIFVKSFTEVLPKAAISKKEIAEILRFNAIDFLIEEGWNIYRYGNTTYGFLRNDGAIGFDYKSLIGRLKRENFITIKSQDLIDFCELTIKLNRNSAAFCTSHFMPLVENDDENCLLFFQDKMTGLENRLECKYGLVGANFDFLFEPKRLIEIIKSLGYPEITIGNEDTVLSLWNQSDDTYIGMTVKINS